MPQQKRAQRPAWGKIALAVLLVAALAAAWRYTPLSELVSREQVLEWARALRGVSWAPVVLVLSYTPASFVLFPRPVLTLIAVIAFGPWLGFAYATVGMMLAAFVSYSTGRALEYERVRRLAGDKLDRICGLLRRHGVLAVLAVRIVPSGPFALEGIVAGALRIKAWHYGLGTFLGTSPGIAAEAFFGTQIARALEDPGEIAWGPVAVVLVLFVALMYLVRRWVARQT